MIVFKKFTPTLRNQSILFTQKKFFIKSNSYKKGIELEKRVYKLLKDLGKRNVKHNIILKDRFGNTSQIDIVYGLFFKTYVECKNYSQPVPLKDVAKFKEVLLLNGISPSRGLFITTNKFVPRAKNIGIECWDGEDLERQELLASRRKFYKKSFVFIIILMILGYYYALKTGIISEKQHDQLVQFSQKNFALAKERVLHFIQVVQNYVQK